MSLLERLTVVAGMSVILAGCYTLQPARSVSPEVGTRVAFDVNDIGRVALGGAMGPEVAQVEGKLVEKDTAGYLVAVTNLKTLRGGEQVWTGERVRLRPEYLGNAYARRFSTGRTVAFSVIGIGGFATFLATRSLLGLGTHDGEPGDTTIIDARLGRP